MLVTLIKKTHISTLSLPEKCNGQYWITDYKGTDELYNLMSIEAKDDFWTLYSNHNAKIIFQNEFVKSIKLASGSFYEVQINNESDRAVIFTENATQDRQAFHKYSVITDCEITIGRSKDNAILFNSNFASSHHAKLIYSSGQWRICDLNSTNGTFVNGVSAKSNEILTPGCMVYIMGLKIIIGNDFIAINNPDHNVKINCLALKKMIVPKDIPVEEPISSDYTEFFYRSPRFKRDIETASFKIDPPPNDQIGNDMPFALTVGPSITMGMASVVTGGFTIANAVSTGNISSAIPAAAMSVSMLLGTMLWPILNKQYEKKRKAKREQLRQEKYTAYLNEMYRALARESDKQRSILLENSVDPEECISRILNISQKLWERSANQNDFLQLVLGSGKVPLRAELSYSERRFSLDEDNLQEEMYKLCETPISLDQVPISISLKEHEISGIVGPRDCVIALIKSMILQLSALYGYDEVKFVFLYDEKEEKDLSFVKWLPHVWDNDKKIRMIATNTSELKEISTYLSREIEKRQALNEKEAKESAPHYIVFALSKKLSLRAEILKLIYSSKVPLNMSVIACFDQLKNLPKECSTVIDLDNRSGKIYDKNDTSGQSIIFSPDFLVYQDLLPVATQLANISLDISSGTYHLPQLITFLEMFGVGKVEHLNAINRWKENDPTKSLEAAVGVNTLGDTFTLDLHEKYHGPHGLVAGMTGSGKSEFIMTYILSLAVNYHPDEVAFVLIDYKGGGMAKSFKNLPHTAGIITNLDGAAIKRSLLSIDSELTHRQTIFNVASEKLGISNIDIYKYQKLYREGSVSDPLPHLFIISDEFAELKTQKPEFMERLISAARIGRSLGVHLILATQKPSGVVDDQIWSNSKFRVCLKVQDRADSMDMLKRPDAAELSDTGRFYLQVGYNELFDLGQSAWAGAPYYPTDAVNQRADESITVIDRNGHPIKKVQLDRRGYTVKNPKKQLDAIVAYLSQTAHEENIHVRKLWLDAIPGVIYLEDIRKKYNISEKSHFVLNPLIGEMDDPQNQQQLPMHLPLSDEGNAIIFGSAGVGKTSFLNAMIDSLITEHTPDEVNLYLMDFSAETLRAFANSPHVGDVVLGFDKEKVDNLFKLLRKEVGRRKKLFAELGGDFNTYTICAKESVPNIVVTIHNFAAFKELYEDQLDSVSFLSREGTKYGIYFVITATAMNNIGFRLIQNFKQLISLQLNDENDYSSIVGATDGLIPAKHKGRGLVKQGQLYEFQTAFLSKDQDSNTYIRSKCALLQQQWSGATARGIPVLPSVVDIAFLSEYYDRSKPLLVPVGVSTSTMEVQYFDFFRKCIQFAASSDDSYITFLSPLIELFSKSDAEIHIFDASNSISLNLPHISCYTNSDLCNDAVHEIVKDLVYRNNTYKDAIAEGNAPPTYPLKVVFIPSLAALIDTLTNEEKENLKAALYRVQSEYNVFFIISDSTKKIVRYSFEKWYTENSSLRDYIWIGDGITNQMQFAVDSAAPDVRGTIPAGFGFVVRNGKATKVKLLTNQVEEDD